MPLLPPAIVTIEEKANRLLIRDAVTIFCVDGQLSARVRGDHDVYQLYWERTRWRCPCPARKRCSHIEAVERVT